MQRISALPPGPPWSGPSDIQWEHLEGYLLIARANRGRSSRRVRNQQLGLNGAASDPRSVLFAPHRPMARVDATKRGPQDGTKRSPNPDSRTSLDSGLLRSRGSGLVVPPHSGGDILRSLCVALSFAAALRAKLKRAFPFRKSFRIDPWPSGRTSSYGADGAV